jgi:hypothetical protein
MLQNAEIYDIECVPNCFLFSMECLYSDVKATWEISDFRDDRIALLEHFRYLSLNQIPIIGFNNINYDYAMIHFLWKNPAATNLQLYQKSQAIISSQNRWDHQVWASERFCPQIDLYKLQHFDNKAKATGLKTLQINMRSPFVVESSLPFDRPLTQQEIEGEFIPYNVHDVSETKKFVFHSMAAIEFRINLIPQFGIDVLNWNDTKIGEQMIIQRLGDELCYDRSSGKRKTKQSPRTQIDLSQIIFPYIRFEHPEFNRVLTYLKSSVLQAEEWEGDEEGIPVVKTKGVFNDLSAIVNGFKFDYGVGGIHGSLHRQRVVASEEWPIKDIDVAALYPEIAIQNRLYPEHLGQPFIEVYRQLPQERKRWQKEKGKKCPEANSIKLGQNGAYGKSNSIFSPLFDPRFTMSITVNGQLLLSMLAERLMTVPTLRMIQINTDGLTYQLHRSYMDMATKIEEEWQRFTCLVLETNYYQRMFIRDVNNYVAVGLDNSVKLKGEYWYPDPLNYHASISNAQPVSWHKRFDAQVSTRAAVSAMVHGTDIETFIRLTTNPYDFCCAVKINRSDKLYWGDQEQQRNTRFVITNEGQRLVKVSPPKGQLGAFKKANGVSDAEYNRVMLETGGAWDARVCTKNQSRYEQRETNFMAGYLTQVVNNIEHFDASKINYDWYLQEAHKLII